ncbi:translin-associated protein X [Lates japonicus]|uniref:Translin-associated protein X n=1 Tax=Lates japonicus TaxID=270547 RepID=A0AAD3R5F5_LATJO|nr:translin-associated protein X [Lates japonicus]
MNKREGEGCPRKNADAAQDRNASANPSSPIVAVFKVFQQELDTKHDKYERLVKISRDVTIESKRAIFLLHRVTRKGGIQEYVEAVSFLHYIRHRSLISLEEINARLVFMRTEKADPKGAAEALPLGAQVLTFQVMPSDYLLGVADLTGELMRMCISSVGNGDIDTPFQLSQFLRQIHDGFSYIGNTGPYEVSKKLHTLRQSLGKVEDACYTLRVRGSEIPKHMLADVFSSRTTLMDPEEGVV